jgi:hypothetical protein
MVGSRFLPNRFQARRDEYTRAIAGAGEWIARSLRR